jgi:hypothetical protein
MSSVDVGPWPLPVPLPTPLLRHKLRASVLEADENAPPLDHTGFVSPKPVRAAAVPFTAPPRAVQPRAPRPSLQPLPVSTVRVVPIPFSGSVAAPPPAVVDLKCPDNPTPAHWTVPVVNLDEFLTSTLYHEAEHTVRQEVDVLRKSNVANEDAFDYVLVLRQCLDAQPTLLQEWVQSATGQWSTRLTPYQACTHRIDQVCAYNTHVVRPNRVPRI